MQNFAFMIHPMNASDITKSFKFARYLPEQVIERAFAMLPSMKVAHITGVRSPYEEAEGWFIACPLTTRLLMSMPQDYVIKKIIQGGRVAEKLGAKIFGLGAFTKVVGDAGMSIAEKLNIPVTTGNSYTVATAIEATREAAREMGHDLKEASVVIMGATGAIGRVCAAILAREVRNMTLVARNEQKLEEIAVKILNDTGLVVKITSDSKEALRGGDVIITVTSAVDTAMCRNGWRRCAKMCWLLKAAWLRSPEM
jgi:fatty aldehyde-generating acyl-ACP reductase